VYVNCHSSYPKGAAENIAKFVKAGGQLITTDHVLHNLLHDAFPGYLIHKGGSTGDMKVPIKCNEDEKADEVLKSFVGEKEWWLAGGSHPITIENTKEVKVLISQTDGSPILVRFSYGEGTVYHMISHFYLQNSQTRGTSASLSLPSASNASNFSFAENMEVRQQQQEASAPAKKGFFANLFRSSISNKSDSFGAAAPMSAAAPAATAAAAVSSSSSDSKSSSIEDRAVGWAKDRGATVETVAKMNDIFQEQSASEGASAINYSNVQSAATSSEFVMRSVLQQKKKRAQFQSSDRK